ncbi:MAG: AAA family ATPase [Desulfovibrionaceae bacterium]|nr:AAA family ATPase [Desulfovibrionaceae bacterium]
MEDDADFKFAKSLHQRKQLKKMKEFSLNNSLKVGILYGIRRTGKSVLLKQWLQNLPDEEKNKAAYISIVRERMYDIIHDLKILRDSGYKYVAIDEITACQDFIDLSASLADNFSKSGMKLFIAGTDSLSLWFATNDALFDRDYTLHTRHISFAELSILTGTTHFDEYIRWGGLLHLEPNLGEIVHSAPLPWTIDNIHQYFNSSIARNIQNSIRRYDEGISAGLLEFLLEDPSMQSAIYG